MAPDKTLEVTVWYLQMWRRGEGHPGGQRTREDVAGVELERPSVARYRDLYNTVGEPWLWVDRRKLSDQALGSIIHHPKVRVFVLNQDGQTAGFAELDFRLEPDLEIAYFGLLPDKVGQGLGSWFMRWILEQAWDEGPRRVWLHTCSLDHPQALAFYQKAGFILYREEVETVEDPRASGLI